MEGLCDLKLGLWPPVRNDEDRPRAEASHQFTIMYNGEVCVCDDVSEARARAIFLLASRAAEEGERSRSGGGGSVPSSKDCNGAAQSAMSMKRSLQRFLEKRKLRLQRSAASPY
ncbi:hypothetical protein MLD38_039305 [Melastoma candidum]|uniref:Uncharacterized protein n=1 Tax=Melastoma candidum TaxID=119954 RepID=A0ACB9L2P9_9MYRT|nr:hypothetical protein MLD38_039305 [Melastoma candidum]